MYQNKKSKKYIILFENNLFYIYSSTLTNMIQFMFTIQYYLLKENYDCLSNTNFITLHYLDFYSGKINHFNRTQKKPQLYIKFDQLLEVTSDNTSHASEMQLSTSKIYIRSISKNNTSPPTDMDQNIFFLNYQNKGFIF